MRTGLEAKPLLFHISRSHGTTQRVSWHIRELGGTRHHLSQLTHDSEDQMNHSGYEPNHRFSWVNRSFQKEKEPNVKDLSVDKCFISQVVVCWIVRELGSGSSTKHQIEPQRKRQWMWWWLGGCLVLPSVERVSFAFDSPLMVWIPPYANHH